MFGKYSYLIYILFFTIPPLIVLWLRGKFFALLRARIRPIALSTLVLTVYGSAIWPVALHIKAWKYDQDKILGIKLFNLVFIEDFLWWFLISLLFASFVSLSMHYENTKQDVMLKELKGLCNSFKYAFKGLRVFSYERNLTIHTAAIFMVITSGIFFKIRLAEWLFIAIAIAFVLATELLNSALEKLASLYTQEQNEHIRFVKDVAAASVLVASIVAAIIGAAIFLPHLRPLLYLLF